MKPRMTATPLERDRKLEFLVSDGAYYALRAPMSWRSAVR